MVYAKTDPAAGHRGVTAFVVPTDSPRFSTTRVPCRVLGSLMPTNAVTLDGVRVPARNVLGDVGQGFAVAMTAMDYGRLSVASRSVGLAQACLDASVEYANQRERSARSRSFQMLKKLIAEMACDSSRRGLSLREAARVRHRHGRDPGKLGGQVLRG